MEERYSEDRKPVDYSFSWRRETSHKSAISLCCHAIEKKSVCCKGFDYEISRIECTGSQVTAHSECHVTATFSKLLGLCLFLALVFSSVLLNNCFSTFL